MKKTNLTRSLLAACSIVALSAVMYGCSSSGEDEAQMNADMYKAQLDALNAAAMAELGEGEALTPETYAQILADMAADTQAALMAAADAADAAQAAALMAAADAADAAQAAALMAAADMAAADQTAALAAAEEAHTMALAAAATAAADDKEMALAAAATAAADDKEMALAAAATAAADDKEMALAAAATAAAAAQKTAVDEAVAAALGESGATAAISAYTRAQAALNLAKATYDLDPTVANAMDYMAKARAAKAAADTANTAAENGTEAQQLFAAGVVTSTGAAVTAASSAVTSATHTAGVTADALQHAMAIVPSPSGMAPEFMVATERTRADGTTVTVTDPGDEVEVDDDEKLDASTTTAPYLAASWIGSKHERTDDDGVEEVVTVYTDIANAGDEPFNTYYADSDKLGVTGNLSGGVLNINEEQAKEAGEAGLLSSPHFARSGNQIITYPADDPDTDDVDESDARMFAGMFHGIPGEYTCAGNTCTSTADKDGNLLTLVGEWSFDPDTAPEGKPHMVFGVTPDPDHIHFGYWLQTTPGEDEEPTTYAFNTFVGGADTFEAGSFGNLEGQAEYEGNAAGIYVRKTLKSTGEVASAVTGEFQADADLTAYFGGADVRASNHYRIEGTVTNFMDGGTELAGWSVKLEKHDFTNNPTDSAFAGGTTVGSEGVDKGAWSGTFFGPEADGAMPSAVAGEFNAHFTNGHVAGAYGTAIVEE